VVISVLAVLLTVGWVARLNVGRPPRSTTRGQPLGNAVARHRPTALPTRPASYFGLYAEGAPASYAGITSFTMATGVRPDLALYYSGWYEPFRASFATAAARHGAVPVVQINPAGVSLAAIASGHFDAYLRSYATAVRSYRRPVVLSFGHEMNGRWYSWGYRHTPPAVFVAAWRHIVTIFRTLGARNVTWMWSVNTVEPKPHFVPDPTAWWPGGSYVNWVGIDGYFHKSSAGFASVFGPTIVKVRELTREPILISETGAPPDTGQPGKIAALFAGVRSYGLLGFVWFDNVGRWDYRVSSPAAIAAFRADAQTYNRRQS
jgi:mannan endo-1,4-beta-mannosidase